MSSAKEPEAVFCPQGGMHAPEPPRQSGSSSLPSAVVEQAGRRLSVMALLLMGAVSVNFVLGLLLYGAGGPGAPPRLSLDRARNVGIFLLSAALLAVARSRLPAARKVEAGLVFHILGAAVMSASFFTVDPLLQITPSQLTWLGPFILLFPLLAPTTPKRAIAAALVAASTGPLCLVAYTLVADAPWPSRTQLVGTFLPYYICAAMAIVPAVVLRGVATDLKAANDRIREIGVYKLLSRLGAGGMGEVWRAEHRLLARPAAIKVIRPRPDASPDDRREATARFEREAKVTAQLRSPHTVSLFDYGLTDDGAAFYAMELLDGVDLETLVQRHGPVEPSRAIHFLRQACDSLAEAHDLGLVHRDVKPANMIAQRSGRARDALKVLDFGLVTLGARPKANDPKLTDAGVVVGTPAFMAPEQVVGDVADPRADLYALGCVGYWLLTGVLVFDAESPVRMLIDHARTPPVPPSKRSKSPIPADLEAVILACLAKDPAERPQSADELDRRLAACEDAGAWTPERARAWWDQHARPAAVATG